MTDLPRRHVHRASLGAAHRTPLFAPAVLGQGKPKLVVIGGGPARRHGRALRQQGPEGAPSRSR